MTVDKSPISIPISNVGVHDNRFGSQGFLSSFAFLNVLSNFSQETFEKIKERNAFLSDFDGMVISYQHHLIKPDPRIYRLLIETYNINPARAVFIDDLEENVKAGREAGFFGIHLPPCADVTPYFLFPEGQETVENSEFRQETK